MPEWRVLGWAHSVVRGCTIGALEVARELLVGRGEVGAGRLVLAAKAKYDGLAKWYEREQARVAERADAPLERSLNSRSPGAPYRHVGRALDQVSEQRSDGSALTPVRNVGSSVVGAGHAYRDGSEALSR